MPRARAAAQISATGKRSPELLLTCVTATSFVLERERLGEEGEVPVRAGMRRRHRHRHDREPEARRLDPPRVEVARMVVVPHDDLVAGLQIEAARDDVVALRGVAGDDDLFRGDAERLGEELARGLAPARHQVGTDLGRRPRFIEPDVPVQRFERGQRRRTQVRRVEEVDVARHEKARADVAPERLAGVVRHRPERRGIQRVVRHQPGAGQQRRGSGERDQAAEVPAVHRSALSIAACASGAMIA